MHHFSAATMVRSFCIYFLFVAALLSGCDRHEELPRDANTELSQDRIWSFMTSDLAPEPRIRKWSKSKLQGLMIVDVDNADFYDQFAPLVRQVGDAADVETEICEVIVSDTAANVVRGCDTTTFDFYFIVTNGEWTDQRWERVPSLLQGRIREVFLALRRDTTDAREGHSCLYALATSKQVPGQIEGALSVIDAEERIALGKCGTYMFLNMLGLAPFDGPEPLDVSEEAESVAAFLLKQTPYGGSYLLKLLYSPQLRPGMGRAEFEQVSLE